MAKTIANEKVATWEKVGKVANAKKISEALEQTNLNFEVEKRPLFFGPDMKQIKDKFATVRTDHETEMGIVGKGYVICQNAAAFEFADYINENLTFTRGGLTYTGLAWLVGEMPSVKILGETYTPAIVLQNSFNGKYCLRANIVPVTESGSAMNINLFGLVGTLTVKHSISLVNKMKQGQKTLCAIAEYMEGLRKVAEKYANIKMGKEQIDMLLNILFPTKDNMSEQTKANVEAERKLFLACYDDEGNKTNHGNAWGIIRAYADFESHTESHAKKNETKKAEFKFMSNTLGKNNFAKFIKKLDEVAKANA